MLLRNRPFLGLTCSLSTGIFIGYFWIVPFLITLFLFLLFASVIVISHRINALRRFFDVFACLIVVVFGIILMQDASGNWRQNALVDNYQSDQSLIICVEEVGDLKKEWVKCTAKIDSLVIDSEPIDVNEKLVIFFQHAPKKLASGDQFEIKSSLEWIHNKGNPGEFDAAHYWNSKGYRLMTFAGQHDFEYVRSQAPPFWEKWMNQLHAYFKSALMNHLDGQEEAVALALVLGDKSLLSRETSTSFMNTGALHVLAVSGLHVGLIMQILLALLGQCSRWISRYQALVFVLILMWVYAVLTGLSPSVLRAVFMFTVLTIGELLGKPRDNLNVLFFTAFVLMLIDPFTLFDIGFQLSFCAMLGIFLFYPSVSALFHPKNRLFKWFWDATAIGFAAQLMTTPLSLYYFHQFPNYFLLANTGLMLTSGLILGIGIALFAFSYVPFLGWLLGKLLHVLIASSLYFLQWVESLPGAVANGFNISIWWVISASLVTIFVFKFYSVKMARRLGYALIVVLFAVLLINRFERLTAKQLIVFNHNQPLILCKNRDRIACFYDAKFAKFDKVKRLVQSYVIAFPGQVFYYPLRQKYFRMNSDVLTLEVSSSPQQIDVQLNGQNYSVLKTDELKTDDQKITIAMPWLETTADHYLKNGAVIIPLR